MADSLKTGTDHRAHLARANKIEGQIRGIKKMIESEKYCVDILTQTKAIRSALKSLELMILEGHLNNCLMDAVASGSKAEVQEKIDEVMGLLKRASKS